MKSLLTIVTILLCMINTCGAASTIDTTTLHNQLQTTIDHERIKYNLPALSISTYLFTKKHISKKFMD